MKKVDYNQISKAYDDVREGDAALIHQFLQELPATGALTVLDLGCGTGNYTGLFQQMTRGRGVKLYGIDPSEGMLNKACQKNDTIVYQVGTAGEIPFQDHFFDFVYMTDVIHHVPDINSMFAELHRVLKAGGKVCIVTQSHEQIERRPIAQFFPGTVQVDQGRYPDIETIIAAAEHSRFTYLKKETIFEGEEVELGTDFLELARKKGYSMLHLLPEHAYQIGLLTLEDALKDGPMHAKSAGETLVWFAKKI